MNLKSDYSVEIKHFFVVNDHLHYSKNLSKASATFLLFISRPPGHAGNIRIKETKMVLASLRFASL